MDNHFRTRKKITAITISIIIFLSVIGVFTIKARLGNKVPEFIIYNSKEYQYYKKANGELLESAKKNTRGTGQFIKSMEIYKYLGDSNLLYLKNKNGEYMLYHTTPIP